MVDVVLDFALDFVFGFVLESGVVVFVDYALDSV